MAINKPTKPKTFSTGIAYSADVNEDFDVIYAKVDELVDSANNAAGSTPSTATRLSVSMNADGTMKTGITAGGEWINSAFTLLYVSTTSFTAAGDRTAIFTALRRVKATLAASTVYSQVVSSNYSGVSGLTTVVIADGVLTNPITSIEHGVISPLDANGSVTPAMLGAVTTATANKLALRDANGKLAGDILGNAATATTTTGNAATATALQTARTIGGVSFNGTANIDLPGVNIPGNQNTTGNAATVSPFPQSQAASGYITLPGGIIMQWGRSSTTIAPGATLNITLPIAFTSEVFYSNIAVVTVSGTNEQLAVPRVIASTLSNLAIYNADPDTNITQIRWFAIGV